MRAYRKLKTKKIAIILSTVATVFVAIFGFLKKKNKNSSV